MPEPTGPALPEAAEATDVYAIHGADPEILAYAMAKYSRSGLTLRESLRDISTERAENFLNTFYFQYGHRSIADLAHVPLAIERLSLLAAIALVDEPRWDGQERSTRYQDFRRTGFHTPAFETPEDTTLFREAAQQLFTAYEAVAAGMLAEFKAHTPRPAAMEEAAYTRTLRARVFDVARYLLPLATNTSLGQITNARTLEGQIARLLGSGYPEIRDLGNKLRDAASQPAWNPNHPAAHALLERVEALAPDIHDDLRHHLLREVPTAPTLVKYTAPSPYTARTREALTDAAQSLMGSAPIDPMPPDSPNVELIATPAGERLTLEIDLATGLLYPHTHFRYTQLRTAVAALPEARILELVALGTAHRGPHDELPRAFATGNLRFDILMDIGGFRDMHRHRRCTQLLQPWTTLHGYDIPDFPGQPQLTGSPVAALYTQAIQRAFATHAQLRNSSNPNIADQPLAPPATQRATLTARTAPPKLQAHSPAPVPVPEFSPTGLAMQWGTPLPRLTPKPKTTAPPAPSTTTPHPADYLLPLATRCRSLFSMDFAQAVYLTELRSTPAGHWSYRNVAWQMYQAVARRHPGLAQHFRVSNPSSPVDLLQR